MQRAASSAMPSTTARASAAGPCASVRPRNAPCASAFHQGPARAREPREREEPVRAGVDRGRAAEQVVVQHAGQRRQPAECRAGRGQARLRPRTPPVPRATPRRWSGARRQVRRAAPTRSPSSPTRPSARSGMRRSRAPRTPGRRRPRRPRRRGVSPSAPAASVVSGPTNAAAATIGGSRSPYAARASSSQPPPSAHRPVRDARVSSVTTSPVSRATTRSRGSRIHRARGEARRASPARPTRASPRVRRR